MPCSTAVASTKGFIEEPGWRLACEARLNFCFL